MVERNITRHRCMFPTPRSCMPSDAQLLFSSFSIRASYLLRAIAAPLARSPPRAAPPSRCHPLSQCLSLSSSYTHSPSPIAICPPLLPAVIRGSPRGLCPIARLHADVSPQRLAELAKQRDSGCGAVVTARIQGPYGGDVDGRTCESSADVLVFAGGIGITAALPLLRRRLSHAPGSDGACARAIVRPANASAVQGDPLPYLSQSQRQVVLAELFGWMLLLT